MKQSILIVYRRPLLTLEDNNLADKDVWHINSQCVCLFMVGTVWWRNKMLLILTAGPESLTFWPGQAVFLLIIDDVIIRFPLITIHATVKPYGQIHQKHTGDYGKINRWILWSPFCFLWLSIPHFQFSNIYTVVEF